MIKYLRFSELMWLMLAIITFIIGVYHAIMYNVYDSLYWFGFAIVAILLFSVKRKQRRFHEKNQQN